MPEQTLRPDVLRAVVRTADRRRDGVLPMDVDGVLETFRDELTLLGALQLHWFARLNGRIERRLARGPASPEATVVRAWAATAREMPGVRAVLDRCAADPTSAEMAALMDRAKSKELMLLASAAGHPADTGEDLIAVGALLELRARAASPSSLRARLRAVLAA